LKHQEGSENSENLKTATTDANGNYVFSKIIPGKYIVEPLNSNWKIQPSSLKVEIQNSLQMKESFEVYGFDIQGKVVSHDSPMENVEVYLYSKEEVEISCETPKQNGPLNNLKPKCVVNTNKDGEYTFKGVPIGVYTVASFFSVRIVYI
jgi:protocatechuate 3,4-dioxygenase beta subunit